MPRMTRATLVLAAALVSATAPAQTTDPLASWNDGKAKQAILKFVAEVTSEGATFVEPAERIAVFDNDGTLWSEQPIYFQLAFALDQVKAMAPRHPEWKTQEPYKTLLAGDVKGALAQGEKAILGIMAATHSGMTTEEFAASVEAWTASAKHPKSGRLYTEMVYQPMLELLRYLRGIGPGSRLLGLVHHTDAEREWAYDRQSHIGKLDKALDEALQRDWTVVDMKKDWKRIYPFEK